MSKKVQRIKPEDCFVCEPRGWDMSIPSELFYAGPDGWAEAEAAATARAAELNKRYPALQYKAWQLWDYLFEKSSNDRAAG